MKRTGSLLLLSPVLLTIGGCGSSSSSGQPTSTPGAATSTPGQSTSSTTKLFSDPLYHFQFRYPATWVPHSGITETVDQVRTYVVRISVPNNSAAPEITLTGAKTPLPSFPNGEVKVDPRLGPGKYQYFHVKISGQPAVEVRHTLTKGISEINTFVEGAQRVFDVRIVVATPPISPDLRAGYNTMTSTLKIPTR